MQELFIGKEMKYQGTDFTYSFDTTKAIGFESRKGLDSWFPFLIPLADMKGDLDVREGATHVLIEVFKNKIKITQCSVLPWDYKNLQRKIKDRVLQQGFKKKWLKTMKASQSIVSEVFPISKTHFKETVNVKDKTGDRQVPLG